MSLSSRVKNKIVDAMNTTFKSIGNANGMRMPKSGNNQEPLAWEFAVAKHLVTLANKRKDDAETACVEAGMIPNKLTNPQPPGKYGMVFVGEVAGITLEVRNSSPRIDARAMTEYLIAHGVKRALIEEAIKETSKTTRPAHVFDPVLLTEVDFGK